MKKYIFILAFALAATSSFGQKKKKNQEKVPVKKDEVQVTINPQTSNGEEFHIVMPETAMIIIKTVTADGQEKYANGLKELENLKLSQLKELSVGSRVAGKVLEDRLLQKIILEADQLEVLEISNFEIVAFPEIQKPNMKLRKLTLDKNNLKILPYSISNLTALENFSCSNPLQALPYSFATLKNLQTVSLNYTDLATFPDAVFGLSNLSSLYISGSATSTSKIKELPDLFEKLPELKELGVTNASLSALPKSVSLLKKLEKAFFSNNAFVDFPEVLAANPNLEYVSFTDNPLQWQPFLASIKKIKWRGLFFLHETGFSKKQYEEIQKILPKIDVYYDGMND